jgi:hypothetical protein
MTPTRSSRRPFPEAYDHLWRLLPVFLAFLAMLFIIAGSALPPVAQEQVQPATKVTPSDDGGSRDPSLPTADEAMPADGPTDGDHPASF